MNDVAEDRTFHDASLYGSNSWAALTMGVSTDTFYRKRKEWEAMGFPKPDRLNRLYLKADVEAWVARRRKLADQVKISGKMEASATETVGVNTDAL